MQPLPAKSGADAGNPTQLPPNHQKMKKQKHMMAVAMVGATMAFAPFARADLGCKDGCELEYDNCMQAAADAYNSTVSNPDIGPFGITVAALLRSWNESICADNQTDCKANCS